MIQTLPRILWSLAEWIFPINAKRTLFSAAVDTDDQFPDDDDDDRLSRKEEAVYWDWCMYGYW